MGPTLLGLFLFGTAADAFSQPNQTGFFTVTPCRVADTRNADGPWGGPALAGGTERTFTVVGRCGIPSSADAVSVNVTVTGASASGALRVYPAGYAPPNASAINYRPGRTRANNGSYALSGTGALGIRCDQAAGTGTHVILDVSGYYETGTAPPPPPPPPPTSARWARAYGDPSDDRGQAVAVDSSGNVTMTGHLDGSTDFGGGRVSSYVHPAMGPTTDVVVAAYSASGGYRWARVIGSDSSEEGKGIATDAFGNVHVTGYQGSYAVDYGGGPQYVRAGTDIFVAKYSSAGSWVWSKTVGGNGPDQGNAVATDAAGSTFVTGYMGASSVGVNLGGAVLNSAGQADVFLVKYSSTGAHLWSRRFGSAGNDAGWAAAVDPAGNVLIAGTFEGNVDFGGGVLSSAGLRDVFVAKYNSAGTFLWARNFGGAGDEMVFGLAVDSVGDVALAGKFQSSVNFGGGNLSSAGSDDGFVLKITGALGAHVWSKRFGGASGDIATAVDFDGSNNVVAAGYFYGLVDFGGVSHSSFGVDAFASKYTASGALLWSRRYGSSDTQIADGVAVAPNGDVILSGFFGGSVDFGTGPLVSLGGYDGFTANIGP
ncbi:MAG TPA: hypothetical protein VNC59_06030 [Thermoanaerobaculia bacterium]|nr:hypothetical protein [Thermoanaerobaculia bacterium]